MQGYQGEGKAFWIQFKYTSRAKAQLPSDCCNYQVFQVFPPPFLLPPRELDGCTTTILRGHSHLLKCLLCTGLCSLVHKHKRKTLFPTQTSVNPYQHLLRDRHSRDRLGRGGTHLSCGFYCG